MSKIANRLTFLNFLKVCTKTLSAQKGEIQKRLQHFPMLSKLKTDHIKVHKAY